MPNAPMTRQNMPPVVAYYSPDTDATDFPWLIVADGHPVARVADSDRVSHALLNLPEYIEQAPSLAVAVDDALRDAESSDDGDTGTTGTADTTAPDTYGLTYSPADIDQPGQLPWIVLNAQGQAMFRLADGDHGLDALELIHQNLNVGNDLEVVRKALTESVTFVWDRFEEINR